MLLYSVFYNPKSHPNRIAFTGVTNTNGPHPQRSDLSRERMCSWAILAEKVAAEASWAVLQDGLNLFLFLCLKSSKLPLNLLCYTAVPVFFQKWPKPAQLNILPRGVTTITMTPQRSFIRYKFDSLQRLRNRMKHSGKMSNRKKS